MKNPIIFSSPGKTTQSGRLQSILWVSETSSGETVIVEHIGGGSLWEATHSSPKGVSFAANGITVPKGVNVSQISSGTLYLYYLEA